MPRGFNNKRRGNEYTPLGWRCLSLIQPRFLTLPRNEFAGGREWKRDEATSKHVRRRRTDGKASRSCRDSTHYRMYAPLAIFDVAVGRVQMKLLLPRGAVDLARNAWSKLSERIEYTLSPFSLTRSALRSSDVIITFNECYLSFGINKTRRAWLCRAALHTTPPLTQLKWMKENIFQGKRASGIFFG